MKSPKQHYPSTQKYLMIAQIKEDTVIMKDGSVRMVLLASSTNFALKSEEEQRAIIASYIAFLNSLDFPLQVVIQSRRLNIDHYLADLKRLGDAQKNELLKIQTEEYHQFVQELVTLGDIMSKRFYIVVSYSETGDSSKGLVKRLSSILSPSSVIEMREAKFREIKGNALKRVDHVANNLLSFGITTALLDTQGLIELYYTTYNPDIAEVERMQDVGQVRLDE